VSGPVLRGLSSKLLKQDYDDDGDDDDDEEEEEEDDHEDVAKNPSQRAGIYVWSPLAVTSNTTRPLYPVPRRSHCRPTDKAR
jgi:hypothetical protein